MLACFLADTGAARDAGLPEGGIPRRLRARPRARPAKMLCSKETESPKHPTGNVAKQCHVEPAVAARRRTLGCFGNTSLSIYELSGAGVTKGLSIYKLPGPGLLSINSTRPRVYILISFGVLGGPRVYRSINSWLHRSWCHPWAFFASVAPIAGCWAAPWAGRSCRIFIVQARIGAYVIWSQLAVGTLWQAHDL